MKKNPENSAEEIFTFKVVNYTFLWHNKKSSLAQ